MGRFETSGISIYFEISGQGDRCLILLHELGGGLKSWDAVVPLLEPHFQVVRYDQRGAGRSEKVRAAYTVEDQVRDLEGLIETAGLQPPYNLAGVAAGAGVALLFAARRPDEVAALILCCPALGVDAARKAYLAERSKLAAREGMRAVVDPTLARSFPPEIIRDRWVYESYRERYLENDPISYGLANHALAAADLAAMADQVRCRCLVIAGLHDTLRPPEQVKHLAKRLPHSEFAILDGGHLLPVQAPEALAARMLEFLLAEPCRRQAGELASAPYPSGIPFFISVHGVRFRCCLDGPPGASWIVFSNSLMTDLSLWDEQVAAFQDSFRILRYDQRGHGGTDVPPSPCTFDLLADDAAALFDVFGIQRAVVIGISMGAVTAFCMAVRHPGRISRVVACDGQWAAPPAAAAAWEERMQIAEEQGMTALVGPTVRRWFRPESLAANPPGLDKVRQMIRDTPRDGFLRCARALQDYDFRSDISKISLPVLLVVGGMDGLLPQGMREMHLAIPGSQFVEIDGAGHLPNVERAKEFNQAIAGFLRESLAPAVGEKFRPRL